MSGTAESMPAGLIRILREMPPATAPQGRWRKARWAVLQKVPIGPARVTPAAGQLELDALELLPCGCVVAVQHAKPWAVRVISLEAKGPHCPIPWHRQGSVLRLDDPFEAGDELAGGNF